MAANPVNDGLYEQLVASNAALEKPLSGLEWRVEMSSSADLQQVEQGALTELRAHRGQIEQAIMLYLRLQEVMDGLYQTVWPAVPTFVLPEPMWTESQIENAELTAAAAIFVPAPPDPATHFLVTEGEQQPPETTERR